MVQQKNVGTAVLKSCESEPRDDATVVCLAAE